MACVFYFYFGWEHKFKKQFLHSAVVGDGGFSTLRPCNLVTYPLNEPRVKNKVDLFFNSNYEHQYAYRKLILLLQHRKNHDNTLTEQWYGQIMSKSYSLSQNTRKQCHNTSRRIERTVLHLLLFTASSKRNIIYTQWNNFGDEVKWRHISFFRILLCFYAGPS